MSQKRQVLIIGGGAAGMVAAIAAARLGAEVTILEKNPRVGKKLLATGNGRCNFTNIHTDISCYFGSNPGFADSALSRFTPQDAIRFFEKLGIAHKVEENGKVFPMSDQASSILDVLMYELDALGVCVICDAGVKSIRKKGERFAATLTNGAVYVADRVILTSGGKAMPASGSDGGGFELAAGLGHHITPLFPALVQLTLEGSFFKRIDGVKFVGTAEILQGGKSLARDRGDILFTQYGISGPPILQISRKAGELLNSGLEALLKVSLLDRLTPDEVRQMLKKRMRTCGDKPLDFSFVGLINKRLIPVILTEAGITDHKRPAVQITPQEQERIAAILTDWRFRVKGNTGWPNAQVTAGGVDTREVNPETMESKLVRGLYLAGEILDIDGKCGGFNLQWAWSSGIIAGQSAATIE